MSQIELIIELEKAIVEQFKLNAYIRELEKTLSGYAKKYTFEKYKGTIIKRNGLQYELFGVRADSYTWIDKIKPDAVRITLVYTIISKIESYQKKKLAEAKNNWHKDNRMGFYDSRKKLWIEESYEVEPETVINNEINLSIN